MEAHAVGVMSCLQSPEHRFWLKAGSFWGSWGLGGREEGGGTQISLNKAY